MIRFELVHLEGVLPGALWSAVDTLREFNAVARVRAPRSRSPAASWRVVDTRGRTHAMHARTCSTAEERLHGRVSLHKSGDGPRVLLLPPVEMHSVPALNRLVQQNAPAVALVRQRFDEGALIAACGTGQWIAAKAGILTEAPVPWLYQSGFASLFPAVRIEARTPLLAGHRVVCAAAPPLLHELVLHATRYAGQADLAHAAAEKLLLNAERQTLSAAMTTGQVMGISRDMPLFRAQSWMQANASRPFVLAEAARAAAISERTLTRLFRQHMGVAPAAYVHDLRIKRAQMWLEGTWRSVEEIAHDCGYADVSAFCRMFARATGTSPNRYREQFTFRGPRALWKAGRAGELPDEGAAAGGVRPDRLRPSSPAR